MITSTVLTLFVAINEAFFMAFCFPSAAYFIPHALERKGSRQFLKDRLLRQGVPLAFQLLIVGSLLSYGLGITVWGYNGSIWAYIGEYQQHYELLDVRPLWSVEALLVFSIVYTLWWWPANPLARMVRTEGAAPGNVAIAVFALVIGLNTFVVRIWLPVGWLFEPWGLQFPHFAQYIGLFLVGTNAYWRGWQSAVSEDVTRGRLWSRVIVFLIILAPILFVAGGGSEGSTADFRGGIRQQALTYALWEQFL